MNQKGLKNLFWITNKVFGNINLIKKASIFIGAFLFTMNPFLFAGFKAESRNLPRYRSLSPIFATALYSK
ncbi:hypothetical protein SAMN04488511_107202 [Pedobacter suwonensis]|uniref:Uncharacterized protein n=1 Tax=Pedobacter suwonensis TaxID=332999 RepID=A0A1I0TAV4_9SPHI|nr:hypothetical protein SAMN04488511_107202 [Pedobacter suwonensis]